MSVSVATSDFPKFTYTMRQAAQQAQGRAEAAAAPRRWEPDWLLSARRAPGRTVGGVAGAEAEAGRG